MVLVMFGLKIALIPLFIALDRGGPSTTEAVFQGGVPLIVLSFALIPFETLTGQAFPIWVLKKLGVRKWWALCVLSAGVFGLLHAPAGEGAVALTYTGGVVLSHCWLSWRVQSFGRAFWPTTLVHVAHNALAMPLFLIGQGFH
jgi:hypothetical protein